MKPKKSIHIKWPVAPKNAEIISKLSFNIDGTGLRDYPVLELMIISNSSGFRYLSEMFKCMSICASTLGEDGEYHIHLGRSEHPFSKRLSDDIELRVEAVSQHNRSRILNGFGVRQDTKHKGDMAPLLKALVKRAQKCIQAEMKTMNKQSRPRVSGCRPDRPRARKR